jgi:hypothetical protein
MIHERNRKRTRNQPPAPTVTRREDGGYNVHSRRSDNDYVAHVAQDGTITCDCKARGSCYHLAYVKRAHDLANLSDGDAVLVREAGGLAWHTAIGADASRIYTLEVPAGFSHVFVVRCERQERQVAA